MLIRRKAAVKESPMTVNERRKAIIDFLQQKHECDVNEIIAQFDVTPATIRRDLSHLEQAGSITRTHGAVQLVGSPAVPGFITRDTLFSQEKLAIAEAASQLVHSGDSVILDSGTTANAVAQRLVGRQDISLITNSLAILLSLKAPAQNLILTGGVLDYENLALIGPDAEAAFEHEKKVTESINGIYAVAYELKDFRTMQFLDWFVKEQGEEEKNTEDILKRYDLFGSDAKSLYLLDSELGARIYTAPSLVL